ncbi:hypothetical protein Ccar_13765 [Clostridium carboxidivorans P7]|uniref:Uncharacterized protein n=1 Tax=Clostridium carboxidivorans P7 TaxID=536227 RepID=C6PXT8_9CLOT|nr:hypothetical protein [Clostridium carboxidivorans]AKN31871.1 hypothetical protein Ccar_13765 [Clostridium carboxidivorans P7]EET85926.1 hypothetical protein CcarbDRAFT_3605 [Clostridium carboxidivorans P7]EFG87279.1 hypothetical protein CLCAR_2802 [Clostridium carboxidivorans P7]
MPEFNSWNVPFSTICFFEDALNSHKRVIRVSRERDIFFRIERDDNSILNTLLLNEYRFGIASLIRALEEFPETEYIIIGGNWNESTYEADEYAGNNNIGIYDFSEFFGAINCDNIPLKYIKKDERNNKKNTFRGA